MSSPTENSFENTAVEVLTVPATKTATVTSSACDTHGYDSVGFYVIYGTSGDTLSTGLKWTGKLQNCTTENGNYSDCSNDDVESDVTGQTNEFALIDASGEDGKRYGISYKGSNRWVKVVITPTGTHTYGTPIAIIAVKKLPRTVSTEDKANP
ncbi:hypothetical protein AMJ86_01130 [bacterium SM23_57]|nr:MAG: hypothetical protein AMJ86_01130 [bacterium SM23_57]